MGCSKQLEHGKDESSKRKLEHNKYECSKCKSKVVITLQHGALCKKHFIYYFEDKVFKTINRYQLFTRKDKVCVAASGGKDSTAALYLTKKYFQKYKLPQENLFALLINEGIERHRNESLRNLEKFCQKEKIILKIVKVSDHFSTTIDKSSPKLREKGLKPCSVCGIWRRYLLNKHSREFGANKLVTGHNLDDEAQSIIMNIFKANVGLAAGLGPVSGIKEHPLFVRRIKPLYFCTNEEVQLYTKLKGWALDYCSCIYSQEGLRSNVKKMLNEFEKKYPGIKQGIIKSYLELLPLLKDNFLKNEGRGSIKLCQSCGEPANQNVCHACKLKKELC